MTVGLGQDAGSVNSWAYQVSLGLEQSFQRAQELQAFIQLTGSSTLQAPPYSFTSTEVAELTSAINDAVNLGKVYTGNATQGTVYDYRTFLKLLRGVSCW